MESLKKENKRLKEIAADLPLDKLILKKSLYCFSQDITVT